MFVFFTGKSKKCLYPMHFDWISRKLLNLDNGHHYSAKAGVTVHNGPHNTNNTQ